MTLRSLAVLASLGTAFAHRPILALQGAAELDDLRSHLAPKGALTASEYLLRDARSPPVASKKLSRAHDHAGLLQELSDSCELERNTTFFDESVFYGRETYEFNNPACFDNIQDTTVQNCSSCIHDYEQACLDRLDAFVQVRIQYTDPEGMPVPAPGPDSAPSMPMFDVTVYDCLPLDCVTVDLETIADIYRFEYQDLLDVSDENAEAIDVDVVVLYDTRFAPNDPGSCVPVTLSPMCDADLNNARGRSEAFVSASTNYYDSISGLTCVAPISSVLNVRCEFGVADLHRECIALEMDFCAAQVVFDLNFQPAALRVYWCLPKSCNENDQFARVIDTLNLGGRIFNGAYTNARYQFECGVGPFRSDECYQDNIIQTLADLDLAAASLEYHAYAEQCFQDGLAHIADQETLPNTDTSISCLDRDEADLYATRCHGVGETICSVTLDFEHAQDVSANISRTVYHTFWDCVPDDCQNEPDVLAIEQVYIRNLEADLGVDPELTSVRADIDCSRGYYGNENGNGNGNGNENGNGNSNNQQGGDDDEAGSTARSAYVAGAIIAVIIVLGAAIGFGVYRYKKRRGRGEIVPDEPEGAGEGEHHNAEMADMNRTATVHGTY